MKHIVEKSIIYANQNIPHDFMFTIDCLRKFVGFLLFTGYHCLPQEKMYWNEDEDTIDCVRKCFPRNRYLEIKWNLHFNYNANISQEVASKNLSKYYQYVTCLIKTF